MKRSLGMNRKTFLGLVPLLVIVAFAVTPVGAQAEEVGKCGEGGTCPRILQNGLETKLEGGKLLPIVSWGTLKLENSKLGLITCRNVFGGFATDPGVKGPGDARGEGLVNGYAAYNCIGPLCEVAGEPVEVTPLGQASNPVTKAKETVGRITVPWQSHIFEPKAKEWQLVVGDKLKDEKAIRFRVVCAAQALAAEFTGELHPTGEAGTIAGAAPAKLEFLKAASGELESAIGTGTVEGKVKLMGYEAAESLSVENR